jgi:subtilase family serine protease
LKVHRIAGAVVSALVLLPATADAKSERVCGPPAHGAAACHARVVVDGSGTPAATTTPNGYGPQSLQSAYNLTSASAANGAGKTIAIVDAYDLPTAQADLNVYRSTYGLPARTITKINQTGGTTPPRVNAGWGQEIALDLDMASAICPNCNILLVEASSAAFTDLAAAENTAAARGATVISNSYGGSEFSQETTGVYASAYNHPGIPITVSSGDSGYGVEYPAASPNVTAVGGTTLTTASGGRGWTERVWSGAGSGCSAYAAKPSWQHDSGCARRTVADTSAVADPATGVAVYDTTKYQGKGGWMVFGGTSVAAPVVAGVYALAGGATTAAQSLYGSSAFYDVTSGSNGSCGGSYLCTATAGYDGPTGLGTPNGTSAY